MRRIGAVPSIVIGALSCFGIVVAHAAAYRLVTGGGHHESVLLEETGHGQWPYVVASAIGLLLAGLLYFGTKLLIGGSASRQLELWPVAARLVGFQSLGFLLLEAAERTLSGAGASHLLKEPAVLAGLGLQLVVALVAALLLLAFARVVRFVAGRLARRVQSRISLQPIPIASVRFPRLRVGTVGWSLRGPPAR